MNFSNVVTKAIILAAGVGSRNLPASKELPKEMLPVYDMPVIERIVRSLSEAGIFDVMIVTGRQKRAIEDHFDDNPTLERNLEEKGKLTELKLIQEIPKLVRLTWARQSRPDGDAGALKLARAFAGDDPVLVIFGDNVMAPRNIHHHDSLNSIEQLLKTFNRVQAPVVLCATVADEDLRKYGVIAYEKTSVGDLINGMVEKPKTKADAPSNRVACGQYVITDAIFDEVDKLIPSLDGEIRLADALAAYVRQNKPVYAHEFDGTWLDTGNHEALFAASTFYAIRSANSEGIINNLFKMIEDLRHEQAIALKYHEERELIKAREFKELITPPLPEEEEISATTQPVSVETTT